MVPISKNESPTDAFLNSERFKSEVICKQVVNICVVSNNNALDK